MNFFRVEAAGLGEIFGVAGGDSMANGEDVLRDRLGVFKKRLQRLLFVS